MSFIKTIQKKLEESHDTLIKHSYLLTDKQKDDLSIAILGTVEYMRSKGFRFYLNERGDCVFEKFGICVTSFLIPERHEVEGLIQQHERLMLLKDDLEKLKTKEKEK